MDGSGTSGKNPRASFPPGGGITDGTQEVTLGQKTIARRSVSRVRRACHERTGRSSCDCVPDLTVAVSIEGNAFVT